MMFSVTTFHPGISALAFFQATQLNLFERFLTQSVAGIDSTNITAGMQNVAYVILVVGFLWQVYQSALHGGDVRGLGTNLIKYVVTAIVVMNYHAIFTTLNQGFVNAGNWVNSASGAGNLFENWAGDLQTQFSQIGFQKMWGLITGSVAGLIDAMLILIAYVLYPVVIVIFGFFYILYGSILYIFGPIVIGLMPLGATNRLAKSYAENVFIWNAWPVLYGGFGALLSAVQMGQVGQMLNQNNFLGGLGNLEGSFLIGFASIIFSLAIAIIPFIAKRIVSGDVGATAAALIGAAATAITAGTAAVEGIAAGAAAGGAGAGSSTGAGASGGAGSESGTSKSTVSTGTGNQPAPVQKGPGSSTAMLANSREDNQVPEANKNRDTGGIPSSDSAEKGSATTARSSGSTAKTAGPGVDLQPTAEAHAEQIRSGVMEASNRGTNPGATPTAKTPEDSNPSTRRMAGPSHGASASTSGRSGRLPNAHRDGLATWGAYHAARLASYGAVAGGNVVSAAAGKVVDAARNPVDTTGKLAGSAGRLAGSMANAAVNTSRSAQSAVHAIAHPSETAERGVQAIGSTVTGVGKQVAATTKGSINEAKTQFSDAYGKKRRENEREQ
ncbi:MAG TPA: hypothetical protein VFN62_03885 [Acidobacteriaceae bacterium]|nr:hypothetical protein [Acidobacteriaceae bacterium]